MKTLIGDLPYICGCVGYWVDCTMFVSRLFFGHKETALQPHVYRGCMVGFQNGPQTFLVSFAAWFAMEFRNLVD